MKDVVVSVSYSSCTFRLISPVARQWGEENFNNSFELKVDVWRAENYINAIEAEGMSVTRGARKRIVRARSKLLRAGRAGGWADEMLPGPFSDSRREGRGPLDDVPDPGLDVKIVKAFGAVLISLLLSVRLWHVAEPLLTDMRQWWQA